MGKKKARQLKKSPAVVGRSLDSIAQIAEIVSPEVSEERNIVPSFRVRNRKVNTISTDTDRTEQILKTDVKVGEGIVISTHNTGTATYAKILTVNAAGKYQTILAYKPAIELPTGSKVAFAYGEFNRRPTAVDISIIGPTEVAELIDKLISNETAAHMEEKKVVYLTDIVAEYLSSTKVGTVEDFIKNKKIICRSGEMFVID